MEIDRIISDYLRGEITDEDQITLNNWLEEDASHKEQLETLQKVWESPIVLPQILNMDDEKHKIWSRIKNDQNKFSKTKVKTFKLTRKILKYAAIAALLFAIQYFFISNRLTTNEPQPIAEIIKRINPMGQKSKIQLPDGSIVWLNAGSALSYTSLYNTDNRKLQLEGEAYFEVTKNIDLPFEVQTNDLRVTALGTSFNVQAFKNVNIAKVALNTGKVKIDCMGENNKPCNTSYLTPGDLAQFNTKSRDLQISEFNGTDPFGWKDGRITFHYATFSEVKEVLSRWYNVEIQVSGELKQEWNYSTSFENEVLENILESLKYSEKIDYEINGSIVKIKL